jgi:hypothetical protein
MSASIASSGAATWRGYAAGTRRRETFLDADLAATDDLRLRAEGAHGRR